VSIEFLPEARWTGPDDVGPVVTVMALHLKKEVKKNDWKFWWRDECGRNTELFHVETRHAPLYRSVAREDAELEGADMLHSVENFWLPLSALEDQAAVSQLLIEPLKALHSKGLPEVELPAAPYLRLADEESLN
jgi:hypothetical protein